MPVVLVTGSASGLGRAIALALAKKNYTVISHYRSKRPAVHFQLKDVVQADLTQPIAVQAMFKRIQQRYKKLDVLINTVGDFGSYQPLPRLNLQDWEEVIRSNLYTVELCTKAAIPLLRRGRYSRIINFSCASAEYALARKFTVPYYIAKSGVITLTKSWASVLAPAIKVNSIAPGILSSSVVKPQSASRQTVSFNAIIAAVQFLISPAAQSISGANLEVSGGWTPYALL